MSEMSAFLTIPSRDERGPPGNTLDEKTLEKGMNVHAFSTSIQTQGFPSPLQVRAITQGDSSG